MLEIGLKENQLGDLQTQLATLQNNYNLLQQDLTCEQQRRYNTETDLNLMTIAYNNEVKERRRWWFSYRDKNRQVGKLIQEKFAFQLLLKQYEYNRDRYYNKCKTLENDLLLADIHLDLK
ncbi:16225_t:CDS:2 [Cetraspora pellucida]|uniref:16225_t:CDS:1 n=1 Tax=Cetraspora pellucida TaxID=1433469 RepID=A0ACA9Q8V6_9GLOM|nr:16225_t:CDS:2 [Cetraspora pellucida]